jgi:hypothetical protein
MKMNGNAAVNKEYNPKNTKPAIPIDIDEADSAMERFIRQKYETRILEDGKPKPPSRDDSSYRTYKSLEDSPPPLPPKTGRKFGFGLRSVSSTSHLPRSVDRTSSPSSPSRSATFGSLSSAVPYNKQSRVFGASVGDTSSAFESKLDALRDMGFPDDRRNATVLKGLGGDIERAIESLVRLGEGTSPDLRSRPSAPKTPKSAHSASGQSSPNPYASASASSLFNAGAVAGDSTSTGQQNSSVTPAKPYNPFDALDQQPSSATGLETAFQGLQVSQPLFPHPTGGYPSQSQQLAPARAYHAPMTPPILQTSQAVYAASPRPLNGNYNPFFQTDSPSVSNGANPFFTQPPQQTAQPVQSLSPTNPFFGHMSPQPTGAAQQTQVAASVFPAQIQHANTMPSYSSTSTFTQPQPQSQSQVWSPQQSYNPFNTASNANPSVTFQQPQAQPQAFYSSAQNPYGQFQHAPPQQQPARTDKNSILALYNLAPTPSMSTIPEQSAVQQSSNQSQYAAGPSPAPSLLTNSMGSTPQNQSPYSLSTPRRSATMPEVASSPTGAAGTRNPFFTSATSTNPFPTATTPIGGGPPPSGLGIGLMGPKALPPPPPPSQLNHFVSRTHMSQGSVDVSGFQNGRHSPDAFAGLSARLA